jgi:hypothetical protein
MATETSVRKTYVAEEGDAAEVHTVSVAMAADLEDAPRVGYGAVAGRPAAGDQNAVASLFVATDQGVTGKPRRLYVVSNGGVDEVLLSKVQRRDIEAGAVGPSEIGVQPWGVQTLNFYRNPPSGSMLTIDWGEYDHEGMGGGGTTLTVVTPGVYVPSACITWDANGTGWREVQLQHVRGGTTTVVGDDQRQAVTAASRSTVQSVAGRAIRCQAGDFFRVRVMQTSGGNLNVLTDYSYLSAHRVGS